MKLRPLFTFTFAVLSLFTSCCKKNPYVKSMLTGDWREVRVGFDRNYDGILQDTKLIASPADLIT